MTYFEGGFGKRLKNEKATWKERKIGKEKKVMGLV